MSETYLRQWSMLRSIPRKPRKITSSELLLILESENYLVSKRTIERDLNSLSLVFPIGCDDRNKPFGWQWMGNEVMDIPSMDIPVALSFSLVSQFLQPLLPRSSREHLEPHFKQAANILKNTQKSGQGKWIDKVRIIHRGQKLIPPNIPPQILDTIYEALLTNKRINIEYQASKDSEIKEYEVNPLGLVFRDASIYMVSTLWKYEDIKQLVLHRIKKAEISDEAKRTPKGFNLDEYIDSGEFGYKLNEKPIKLSVLFDKSTANHLIETKLSEDQVIKDQEDGKVLLTAMVQDTQELRWWLMGFGDDAEVVSPKRLRNEFKLMADKLVKKYSRAT